IAIANNVVARGEGRVERNRHGDYAGVLVDRANGASATCALRAERSRAILVEADNHPDMEVDRVLGLGERKGRPSAGVGAQRANRASTGTPESALVALPHLVEQRLVLALTEPEK